MLHVYKRGDSYEMSLFATIKGIRVYGAEESENDCVNDMDSNLYMHEFKTLAAVL